MSLVEQRCSAAQARLNHVLWVDTVDVCNLKCPTCVRGLRGMPNSGKALPLDKFDRIAAKARDEGYGHIGLYSWTEPFINPRLFEYVAVIKNLGLYCLVSTNFSLRRIPNLESALRAGLDHLTVSVSGFDQDVYEINHVGGNIAYVKENLRRAAELKRKGEISTHIVLRFIEFYYNHDQKEKLAAHAADLGIDFETIEGDGGDPQATPFIPTAAYYDGLIASYRSERPHEGVGKVCSLMFGQTPVDADGNVFLCCAYPYYDAFRIGSYLDLPQEEILLRRYSHPMCAVCKVPRRDATPDDHQALVEAVGYRMGQVRAEPVQDDHQAFVEAEADQMEQVRDEPLQEDLPAPWVEEAPQPVAVPPGPVRRAWRAVVPLQVRHAIALIRAGIRSTVAR
ncbi:MAG TPA: radical SAM protein [Sphingomicrobium sp.]|nr:radical SAM protein [Sphingomicrobium sp.]